MRLYPPNYESEETDFSTAYENAVRFCFKNGYTIDTEYGQKSLDMCSRITLSGRSIHQIKSRQLHKKFPTKGKHLQEYIKQFTPEFDASKFEYTYYNRLTEYPKDDLFVVNQLEDIKWHLRNSRRLNAITWIPSIDIQSEHPPCLQRLWIRVLEEPDYEFGIKKKGMVELHLMWRSRDLYTAWPVNIIALVFLVYNEILEDNYEIVKLVDFVNSAHINENDWQAARLV